LNISLLEKRRDILVTLESETDIYAYNGAFTLDVKSMLNENLGGTQC
jgi:hypothetical protein